MVTRYIPVGTATLFALICLSVHAQASPPVAETHEVPIDQQVEVAQSMADHEAVAQRFDAEAARLEKQAAEYERLAKVYRSNANPDLKRDAAVLATHCEHIAKKLKESALLQRQVASMHRNVLHKLLR